MVRDISWARGRRFDEAWVLPNSWRSAFLAFASGSHRRFGYSTDHRRLLLTESVEKPASTGHQLRDYDRLLSLAGIEPDGEAPKIAPSAETFRKIDALLDADRLRDGGSRPVFLAPGAAFGETKRWPAERFALLADAVMDGASRAALLVGPSEIELGRLVARRARHRIPILGADLDTGELAALLSRGRLLIGNDSGAAHLAASVGTPCLVFFGPTDPGRTTPRGAEVRVIDRYVHCSPCYLKKCPFGHECMEEITVEMAFAAARSLLEATPPTIPGMK
jgi:heptosyltransferase-2